MICKYIYSKNILDKPCTDSDSLISYKRRKSNGETLLFPYSCYDVFRSTNCNHSGLNSSSKDKDSQATELYWRLKNDCCC